MTKVVTAYGNFSKGQIDHDMNGRYDLPAYNTGMDIFSNFISNYKGNAIYSSGFLSEVAFQDCAFVEFKFGITQDYLAVFYTGNVQFLAYDTNGNFGWVLSGGVPLVVSSPYTLTDAKFISQRGSYSQNSDVMYIAHRNYPPYKLTRTASNAFTLATYVRTSDPFTAPTNIVNDTSTSSNAIATGDQTYTVSAGKLYVIGQPITLTADANDFQRGVVKSYSGTSLVVTVVSITGTGTFTAWTIVQTPIGWPGAVSFYKGRLFFGSSTTKLTTMWMSNIGLYDDFTVQSPITDASGFSFTVTDITQQIEWIFPGDNSLILGSTDGLIAVNGGTVNTAITPQTVQANITSAEPTNGMYPLKKNGLVFYVGRANRNIYYFKYDILSEAFISKDANLAAYDITRGGLQKIRYRHDRNSLIYSVRGDNHLISLVFQEAENINGWHDRNTQGLFTDVAVMGDNLGNPQLFTLVNRNGTFYIEKQVDYVEFKKRADFWTPSTDPNNAAQNQDIDTEAYLRYISEQLRACVYLDNALTLSDLRSSTVTFTNTGTDPNYGNEPSGTLVSTASDFTSADVGKHIVYKTLTGYESGRYIITAYTNGTTVSVTVLQTPKIDSAGPVSTNLYVWSSWYKTFNVVNGLAQYNGKSVGLVTDGGFQDAVVISGGTTTLPQQVASLVVGQQYTGIIKSMSLGFVFQGKNTQITYKEVTKFSMRCVCSMGLKVGTSLYDLTDVQLRTPTDLNYLPPSPIDGTRDVEVTDDSEEDKFVYIVQDQPLPACITNFMVEAEYVSST